MSFLDTDSSRFRVFIISAAVIVIAVVVFIIARKMYNPGEHLSKAEQIKESQRVGKGMWEADAQLHKDRGGKKAGNN